MDKARLAELRAKITPGTPIGDLPPYPIFIEMADYIDQLERVREAAIRMSWRVNQMSCPFGEIDNLDEALSALEPKENK